MVTTMREILDASGVKIILPKIKRKPSKYLSALKWAASYSMSPKVAYEKFPSLSRRRIRVFYKRFYRPMGMEPKL